jgi:hypothetical protein
VQAALAEPLTRAEGGGTLAAPDAAAAELAQNEPDAPAASRTSLCVSAAALVLSIPALIGA